MLCFALAWGIVLDDLVLGVFMCAVVGCCGLSELSHLLWLFDVIVNF